MNTNTMPISRRRFLLSGAATAAYMTLPLSRTLTDSQPLRAHIVGWGRHGRSFRNAVRAGHLTIASVLDVSPGAARLALLQLSSLQPCALPVYSKLSSFLRAYDGCPILLCSPPSEWRSLIRALHGFGQLPPILAYHTDCFDAIRGYTGVIELDRCGGDVFLIADPDWPRISLASYFDFARSRGALSAMAQLEHSGWPNAEVKGVQFSFLDCALPNRSGSLDLHSCHFHQFENPDQVDRLAFHAAGNAVALETVMEIRASTSRLTHSDVSSPCEALLAFRAFSAAPCQHRRGYSQRQRMILHHILNCPL